MQFAVTVLCSPKIEGNRSDFVDLRNGATIFGHVNGFEVDVTGVAVSTRMCLNSAAVSPQVFKRPPRCKPGKPSCR
jgi:hypothetical protein